MKLNEVKANPFLLDRLDHTGRQQYYKRGFKGAGVTIGVLDTGVLGTHQELAGKIFSPTATDPQGHGSRCATLIAGAVLGIVPDAKLVPYQREDVYLTSVVTGLRYLRNWRGPKGERVQIISLSVSGSGTVEGLREEVIACDAAGILIVCAAGNTGVVDVRYPAEYEETLAVGAVTNQMGVTTWATRSDAMDICMYGDLLITGTPGTTDEYSYSDGTSFGTPIVAGMAALWYQKYKSLFGVWPTPKACRQALMMTAIDLDVPGDDYRTGAGFASLSGHLTTRIQLTINQPSVKVNGYSRAIDQAPVIMPETGRTVVPVRALAEALGCEVSWDPVKQQIDIVGVKA